MKRTSRITMSAATVSLLLALGTGAGSAVADTKLEDVGPYGNLQTCQYYRGIYV